MPGFASNNVKQVNTVQSSLAFIRQLVGPASKIKEMRRLEALTSLSMVTHGAMFHAWETGKLPTDHQALLDGASLRPEYLYVPEGKGVAWDAARQTAVSDAYNTLHFATPLVELPIDKITAFEEQTYRDFRESFREPARDFANCFAISDPRFVHSAQDSIT